MLTAKDYPVTFKYGATTPPYSPSRPHKGADRACPVGTPIVIDGVTIGLTGRSGKVTGPHLHNQAGYDKACQNTFDPSRVEFRPGLVVYTRSVDTGDWGKCITMLVGADYITYAHLSQVNVKVGDIIGGNMSCKSNQNFIIEAFNATVGRAPQPNEIAYYTGKPHDLVLHEIMIGDERREYMRKLGAKDAEIALLKKQLAEGGTVLSPGRYVVK